MGVPKTPTPGATPHPGLADTTDFKVKDNLSPYGDVTIRSPRTERDEAEPSAPTSLPLPHRQRSIDRFGSVGDSLRRSGGEHGPQDEVTARPKVANFDDAHFTPGTLQRAHDNDGYSKINTRPTGQGGKGRKGDSGARQAEAGTRGVEGGSPTESAGPFKN